MVEKRHLEFPQDTWILDLVRQGLAEDVGGGDVSTGLTVDPSVRAVADLAPRQQGVTAGLPLLELLYAELDPAVTVACGVADGTAVEAGTVLARLEGPAASLLTGERLALNFLQHLGGIATLTARYVAEVAGTGCQVLDTRKTLPGFRALAKYAVRCGGGANHRMGLHDRIMLKDNHWTASSAGIDVLVAEGRLRHPDLMIEIEVDGLDQLDAVLPLQVDWILLDNFSVQDTVEAVARRDRSGAKSLLESSGNVTLETIAGYARAGVDAASVGRLTHSAPAWDLGLDFQTGVPDRQKGGRP